MQADVEVHRILPAFAISVYIHDHIPRAVADLAEDLHLSDGRLLAAPGLLDGELLPRHERVHIIAFANGHPFHDLAAVVGQEWSTPVLVKDGGAPLQLPDDGLPLQLVDHLRQARVPHKVQGPLLAQHAVGPPSGGALQRHDLIGPTQLLPHAEEARPREVRCEAVHVAQRGGVEEADVEPIHRGAVEVQGRSEGEPDWVRLGSLGSQQPHLIYLAPGRAE
mmetsp:Transcript_56633/g.162506  ORF Transcript_56633/g.162506 Transcript_56633/m.162506 type:complete len:221 (+) Transcript_56633:968-1630(+)